MCGDIMGLGSWESIQGIFNGVSGSITNIFWWYRLFIYGGLCPIYFFRELGFSGSIFAFQVSYF